MTVIAFDGKTLAADRMSSANGYARQTRKIHVVADGIVGFAGGSAAAAAMLEWFQKGRDPAQWPAIQHAENRDCTSLFIDWNGQVWLYEDHPHPMPFFCKFEAIGSGRDFALAALHLGHDAVTAVKVASDLNVFCGLGCDILDFEKERACRFKPKS